MLPDRWLFIAVALGSRGQAYAEMDRQSIRPQSIHWWIGSSFAYNFMGATI